MAMAFSFPARNPYSSCSLEYEPADKFLDNCMTRVRGSTAPGGRLEGLSKLPAQHRRGVLRGNLSPEEPPCNVPAQLSPNRYRTPSSPPVPRRYVHTMGSLFTRVKAKLEKREGRILMVGLDGAGKTTVLYKLKLGETITTLPTPGFNVETVEYKNISFTVWDVGGQDKLRQLWRQYYDNAQGLIFVVDSSDVIRMEAVSLELEKLFAEPSLAHVPLLLLANKQDLPKAMAPAEIISALSLERQTDRKWHVQATCAIYGRGLYEGLDWLADVLGDK